MATTVGTIIDAARARSNFNDAEVGTVFELTAVIDRFMKRLFSMGARVNRYYFSQQSTVAASSGTWARPATAEMVWRVEKADSTKVNVVPFEDKKAELPPRIYELGQVYHPTSGEAADLAGTETLTFFFSKRHTDLSTTGLSSEDAKALTLDALWPEQFNDLPVLKVSQYLAVKDSRGEEAKLLEDEMVTALEDFIRHLEHENAGMVARWSHKNLIGLAMQDGKG